MTVEATESIAIRGRGAGDAPSMMVSTSRGSGQGDALHVGAKHLQLSDGGAIQANSTGAGDASTIQLQVGDTFQSQNGTVTTETAGAGGGTIALRAGRLVQLIDSELTTSVRGGRGDAGNITIDPQFVILEGSQIIANAFEGRGGTIGIEAGVFLAYPNSLVDAPSALGIQGTVEIRAPVTNLSGALAPLPQAFVSVAELLSARCAARLAGGTYSSLVLGGREGLPPDPGGLLPSPLTFDTEVEADPAGSGGPLRQNPTSRFALLAIDDKVFPRMRVSNANRSLQTALELGAQIHWGNGKRTSRTRGKRVWTNWRTWLWIGLVAVCLASGAAHAQGALGLDPSGRPRRAPPLLLPEEPLREEPQPSPPPAPRLPPLPPPPTEPPQTLPLESVFVREIRIIGSTVFSPAELAEVTAPYVNRELTAEDLEALRLALTRYYITRGYVNSGAIIPDQTVTEGVLTVQVIEGELTRIEVEGNRWFRDSYFQKRLSLGAGPPLNINTLQEQLQLLLQDSRIQRLNTELRPGVQPGESVLDVRVEERHPYRVWLAFNNYQSPTVGAERGLITLAHENLTGHGDILSVQYGGSIGVNPLLDASYALPLTARDTTVVLRYQRNVFLVVEEPFEPLDIDSQSEIFGVTLRHPVYRTLNQEFALELTGERLSNRTFLLDEPFSFSPGAHRGLSTDTAIRFAPQWVYRTPTQVLAARSRFSVGIDALGATLNPSSLPDGRFFAWLGQLQLARRLGLWDAELLWRTDLQLANNPLLPLEQIAVGGRYSVRGYRENQLVRDNGLLASLEVRLPVLGERRWAEYLQLAPFVDVGHAWNTKLPTPAPKTLVSVGLGLRWAATLPAPIAVRPQFELYWGFPLNDVETQGGNLQDWGLHLQLLVALF